MDPKEAWEVLETEEDTFLTSLDNLTERNVSNADFWYGPVISDVKFTIVSLSCIVFLRI